MTHNEVVRYMKQSYEEGYDNCRGLKPKDFEYSDACALIMYLTRMTREEVKEAIK